MTQASKSNGQIAASLSPLKQALLALDRAQSRVRELEDASLEPIAVVGVGCRFPGCEEGAQGYWRLLVEQRSAVSDGVERRLRDAIEGNSLPLAARWAAMLEQVDQFDPQHFGISPREAVGIDPQQRLLLEVSWEALENAGIDPASLYQSSTGVYVGISSHDYAQLLLRGGDADAIDTHFASGVASSVAAGRISYCLGLNGPCLSIDTACSSSLVAVHLACEALRHGECRAALAGGVNLILSHEPSIAFARAGMLSQHGVVQAFGSGADGFVRGEGCGVVVLKRLSDAQASGDRILGLILGSAVNQDGASSGLTVPNGLAQQQLLREAHRRAGIEPWQVGYVEAHGTGTSLGDPIEAEALSAVFAGTGREKKLLIGSVKTNIGHLEAAAGIAGLIKVVLGLKHEAVPGQVCGEHPSEHVRWDEVPLEVVKRAQPWDPIGGRRIAGISSFGFSGTNAHVVVEGWQDEAHAVEIDPQEEVLPISARTEAALRALVQRYAEFVIHAPASWGEICYTAELGRAVFGERLAVVASSKVECADKLRSWLAGANVTGVDRGVVKAGQPNANKVVDAQNSSAITAEAFVAGATVDWAGRWKGEKPRRVELPGYVFQRERYWIKSIPKSVRGKPTGRTLLGHRQRSAGVAGQYETQLRAANWLDEHVVAGRVILPAAGHIELMLEAGAEALGPGVILRDLLLQAPLVVEGERRVQTVVDEENNGCSRVRIYAELPDGGWERVSECSTLRGQDAGPRIDRLNLAALQEQLKPHPTGDEFYAELASRGLEFGPKFRGLARAWQGDGVALGEVVTTETAEADFELSPWWLDACLQVAALASVSKNGDENENQEGELYLPLSAERIEVYARPDERNWSYVTLQHIDVNTLAADVTITDQDGRPIVRINNLRFRKFRQKSLDIASCMYQLAWRIEQFPGKLQQLSRVLVVGAGEFAETLTLQLRERGADVDVAAAGSLSQKLSDSNAGFREAVLWVDEARNVFDKSYLGDASRAVEDSVRSLLTTAQQLLGQSRSARQRLYVVTTLAQAVQHSAPAIRLTGTPLVGLANGIAMEAPELRCTRLDCDGGNFAASASRVVDEVLANADSQWVAWRAGTRFVAKLDRLQAPSLEQKRVRLQAGVGIDALEWAAESQRDLQPDEVEIGVAASSLNFRDVLVALGVIGSAVPLGTDCAGMVLRTGSAVSDVSPGDAVVAIASGSFASHVVTPRELVVRKPEALSFAEAAAQSIAYLTADHCLNTVAQMREGERVLIHAAAGGVGLAALHLCRSAGVEPVVTAGSPEKRAFLRALGVEHVYDSRSLAFGTEISGGVDVILNSLSGEAIDVGLHLLKPGGRFIELGKTDLRVAASVEQRWPAVRYLPVDLTPHFTARSAWVGQRLAALLKTVAEGQLPTLPVTEFDSSRIQDAFRLMARAGHKGRVVVTRNTTGQFAGTHLVTGGMRGIGLKLVEWLVANGARALVLVGRRVPDEGASRVISRLMEKGVEIHTVQGDIADLAIAERAVQMAGRDLNGVWHCAGILDNASLQQQSWDRMQRVFAPKIDGAWNLHVLSRDLPIKYFVLFSSWASIGGSYGQANHCAAAFFLDGLAHFRRAHGLAALGVNWGAWGETGAASNDEVRRNLERSGMDAMPPARAFEALRLAVLSDKTQVAIASVRWPRYLAQRETGADRSLYSELAREAGVNGAGRNVVSQSHVEPHFAQQVATLQAIDAMPAAMREVVLLRTVAEIVRRTLGLHSGEEIDPDVPLSDLGMDSLLAVQLRNGLSAVLHKQLPQTIVFDYPTLRALARYADKEALSTSEATPVAPPVAPVISVANAKGNPLDILETIEGMSEEEVESWFK